MRPKIHCYCKDAVRDPLAMQFYNRVAKRKCLNFITDPAKFKGVPDIVHIGFHYFSPSIFQVLNTMRNPKIIVEVGDADCVMGYGDPNNFYRDLFKQFKITGFIHKFGRDWPYANDFRAFCKSIKNLRNAFIKCIPWGIDPTYYYSYLKKSFDVACCMSIGVQWKFHTFRKLLVAEISKYQGPKFVGNVYGKEYIDTLARSRYCVVDTGGRGVTTQKYLEAALCGSCLIGEIPKDTSMWKNLINIIDANPRNIRPFITNTSEEQRLKIAKAAKRLILKNRHIDISCGAYEKLVRKIQ